MELPNLSQLVEDIDDGTQDYGRIKLSDWAIEKDGLQKVAASLSRKKDGRSIVLYMKGIEIPAAVFLTLKTTKVLAIEISSCTFGTEALQALVAWINYNGAMVQRILLSNCAMSQTDFDLFVGAIGHPHSKLKELQFYCRMDTTVLSTEKLAKVLRGDNKLTKLHLWGMSFDFASFDLLTKAVAKSHVVDLAFGWCGLEARLAHLVSHMLKDPNNKLTHLAIGDYIVDRNESWLMELRSGLLHDNCRLVFFDAEIYKQSHALQKQYLQIRNDPRCRVQNLGSDNDATNSALSGRVTAQSLLQILSPMLDKNNHKSMKRSQNSILHGIIGLTSEIINP